MDELRLLILQDNDPTISMILQGVIEDTVPSIGFVYTTLAWANNVIGQHFDLVLLHSEVPDGTSYNIAKTLKRSGTAFCFVSGKRPADLPEELSGCSFIEKPYTNEELQGVIMNATREKEKSSTGHSLTL
jgi:DNA-binding response OmpR family regulator